MLSKELYVIGLIAANIVEETVTLIAQDIKREAPRQWESGWIRHHAAADNVIVVLWQVGLAIAAWYTLSLVKSQPKLTGWQPVALLSAAGDEPSSAHCEPSSVHTLPATAPKHKRRVRARGFA